MFIAQANEVFNLLVVRDETPMDRVLAKLKKQGKKPADFAREMDVLPQHVYNWIKRGIPTDRLQKAAIVLKCSVDELLGNARRAGDTKYWPFLRFSPEDIHSLSDDKRREVEAVVAQMIAAYQEAADTQKRDIG